MLSKMKLLFIFLVSLYYVHSKEVLRHAHVIYRHGDRAPTTPFSSNLNNTDVWPFGLSQLTDVGMRQQFELGKWLRIRYSKLLEQPYNHEDIHVRCTDVDRTMMSAESNLAGLYYLDNSTMIPGLNWRPVPVHIIPIISDTLVLPPKCNMYRDKVNEMYKNASFSALFAEYQSTLDVMRKITKNPNLKFEESWYIHDSLLCEKSHNLTLGSWVTDEIYENIRKIYELNWKMMYQGEELGRLSGGRYLDKIVNEMKEFVTNNNRHSKPFQMISGHDQDVAALLSALGVYDGVRPPYAACLMLELSYNPINDANKLHDWIVRIYYKTKATDSLTNLHETKLPGCKSQPCKLSDFIDYLRPRTIDEESYNKLCSSAIPERTVFGYVFVMAVLSVFIQL